MMVKKSIWSMVDDAERELDRILQQLRVAVTNMEESYQYELQHLYEQVCDKFQEQAEEE